MKLSEIGFQKIWNTEDDNVLEDFYIKALSSAQMYYRATYTFSSSILADAAQGIDGLIDNDGEMRLIIGDVMSEDDYIALEEGDNYKKYETKCIEMLRVALSKSFENKLYAHRCEILKWMVGAKKLQIKFALMKNTKKIFHDKSGVIYGKDSERVAFLGSGNETVGGVDLNWEQFHSYFSWDDAYDPYGKDIEDKLINYWNSDGSDKKFRLFTLPSEKIKAVFSEHTATKSSSSVFKPLPAEAKLLNEEYKIPFPSIPKKIGNNKFEIRPYQKAALNNWRNNNYKGILKHATGSGKTLTAIYGITKLFLSDGTKGRMAAVIGVPYQILADQWAEEFKLFNINPIICYGNSSTWKAKVDNRIADIERSNSTKQLMVLIVVNASLLNPDIFTPICETLKTKKFKTIFVGDECHEYAGRNLENLPNADYRLGLSATPFNEKDDVNSITKDNNLKSYFIDEVDTFSLEDALANDYLCKYEYHPIFISLNEDEEKEYLELTRKIASFGSANVPKTSSENKSKDALMGQRARLIGSAEDKFVKLKKLASSLDNPSNTLIFCGDGSTEDSTQEEIRDKIRAINILRSLKWDVAEFTAEVSNDVRKSRIRDFKDQTLDALVAIKVLDQGVNIPAIATAIIVASSRSKRQYIQRLGRVLRKSKNKDLSHIYDFIVLPYSKSDLSKSLINLVEKEKERFDEFSKCCENKNSINNVFTKHTNLIL
jgi:superfamily II DNA or RNA helicase